MDFIREQDIDDAVGTIRKTISLEPKIGMILGSGLGPLADAIEGAEHIDVNTVPGWPVSTVEGHSGRLVFGRLEDVPVFVLQGRAHYYEGHSIERIGLPVRVMQKLGVEILIVTNAAGAVHPEFSPGELMLISDHINLIGMAGQSPLRGPNLDAYGPRFPDMSQAYDPELKSIARSVADSGD
ncbi:MAG: purine-nucleoside phosphorylase, partial [Anaerolineales bacterium]